MLNVVGDDIVDAGDNNYRDKDDNNNDDNGLYTCHDDQMRVMVVAMTSKDSDAVEYDLYVWLPVTMTMNLTMIDDEKQ